MQKTTYACTYINMYNYTDIYTYKASLILSKKNFLTSSTIFIKCDLSCVKRGIEKVLLYKSLIINSISILSINLNLHLLNKSENKFKLLSLVQKSTFVTVLNHYNILPSESMDSSKEQYQLI